MLAPGVKVGGYIIEALLGRGAMGEVYRAHQVSLKRPVAIKRIADHLLDKPEHIARFEREAVCVGEFSLLRSLRCTILISLPTKTEMNTSS